MFSSSPKSSRHCPARPVAAVSGVASMPGLGDVAAACDMLRRSQTTRAVLSIHHSDHDAELIEQSRETAAQFGVHMDVEARDGALVLRFSRNSNVSQ